MKNKKKLDQLRTEAEARLKTFTNINTQPSLLEVKSLVHELSVYQLELEMQNQELREAQHRLEESRDQYTDLFEFAPLGYFILNKKGIILNCNLTGCGLLGQIRSQLTGKIFAMLVGDGSNGIEKFQKHLLTVFNSEMLETCELSLKRKGNEPFTAQLTTITMKDDDGDISQCRMAVTDISQEKKAESMQSLMEAVLFGQESERERIAAELHDSINPLLSIASLTADSLYSLFEKDKEQAKDQLENLLSLLGSAMRGIKEISKNLSPAILKTFGLSIAVEQVCQKVKKTRQLNVNCITHGLTNRLDSKVELALYRMTQELMNNILKHANATQVELQLIRHKESVVLMIHDNGIGFDAPLEALKTNGFGFKNIASRVQSLNGSLSIDSAKNKGTTVTIELPV